MEKGTNFKYIVYLTTNKVNNKIYIGVHKTLTPDKFDGYIGCGILINEPNTYSKPKTHFQYAVKKHGVSNFNREILAIFDTAEEYIYFACGTLMFATISTIILAINHSRRARKVKKSRYKEYGIKR